MKKLSGTLFIAIALFITPAPTSAQLTKPEKVYQQALYEMEGLGNYTRAIELFNQVVIQAPKEKSTAAKALLQIGLCYEKLGEESHERAAEAYQKVIDGYMDQADAVRVARQKLAMLNQVRQGKNGVGTGISLHQLSFSQLNTPAARLSPDGKKLVYAEYGNDNKPRRIRLLDLDNGSDRILVEGNVGGGPFSLAWSPGNKSIAYATGRGHELREISADSGESRTLWKDEDSMINPFSWSRDGKIILCGLTSKDARQHAGVLTVATGEIHVIVSGTMSEYNTEAKLSPEGKYVVCAANRSGNTDIYVWSVDGKREIRLTDHPSRDDNPQWSPDGKYIVFLSDRAKSVDLWAQRMHDSVPSGPPFPVKRDLGWRTLISDFVASGKLLMLMVGGGEPQNLLALPVDGNQGIARGSFAPLSTYPTDHFQPRWSPKGDMVPYTSRKGQIGRPRLFVLNDQGAEQELPLRGHYANSLAWHPNGTHLQFAGWDSTNRAGLYQVSMGTQEISTVSQGEQLDPQKGVFAGALINLHCLPARGKMIFFKGFGGTDVAVVSCEVDGSNSQVLSPRVKMPMWGRPSPDGGHVSYLLGDTLRILALPGELSEMITIGSPTMPARFAGWSPDGSRVLWTHGTKLNQYSLQERKSRTLHELSKGKWLGDAAWSPNGACVAFVVRDSSSTQANEIFVLDLGKASVRKLCDAPKGYLTLSDLQWSPTGDKILASGGTLRGSQAPIYEHWTMENFLPKE